MPVSIDPKMRNFPASIDSGVTLVTPNHHEALRMAWPEDDSDEGLYQAGPVDMRKARV